MALLSLLAPAAAMAATIEVSAEYRPDVRFPNRLEFTNTTELSGNCLIPHAEQCRAAGFFGVRTPIRGNRTILASGDTRETTLYVGLPPDRVVEVFNAEGERFSVTFGLVAAGYRLGNYRETGAVGSTVVAPACRKIVEGVGGDTGIQSTLFLLMKRQGEAAVACHNESMIPRSYSMTELEIGFAMKADSPLALPSGRYMGSTSYTVGDGLELDLGANTTVDDNVLEIHFTMDVEHAFNVHFAPSPRVSLAPEGGWLQWTQYNRLPARLRQDLPFTLTSSSEFSLRMRCQHEVDDRCGIRNPGTGTVVPLDVSATLPSMNVIGHGLPASEVPLVAQHGAGTPPRFIPRYYSPDRTSLLHFSVNGAPVKTMVDEGAATWAGDVTVIFDANP